MEWERSDVLKRTILVVFLMFHVASAKSQILTVAGGQTIRAGTTEHDAYRVEMNFGWKPAIWSNNISTLSLNHALSMITFRDKNDVNAISWAPNITLHPRNKEGYYPYLQLSFGIAYLSEDQFESKPKPHPLYYHEGITDMGSHGQFESSFALGLTNNHLSIRVKIYHYSNGELANKNEGMDVMEFGVGYRL